MNSLFVPFSMVSSCSGFIRFVLSVSVLVFTIRCVSSAPLCPLQSDVFRNSLQSQCSVGISPNPPIQVDGEFLDRALTSKQRNNYDSVLFYASWCPISHNMHSTFEVLSSMFPQMEHFAIEQSSALPSLYSRYGIHSLPSILLVNQTSRLRYRGPKDLHSLVQFYQKTTGFEPVEYFAEDESASMGVSDGLIMQSWNRSSLRQMIWSEPYLVFAVFFLCLRVLISIFPDVLSHLKAFWDSYVPHLNLEIFGETSQIFGRALHMIDVRRVLTRLRLCKTRNFHEGAKNARVWASLASVSLGEPSSSR
ncbi:5'-adenylylsulfate reductase-like 7 [Mangifera indica]|uniref:5'-adenylylsulfate reductase-like 7 n=1 Tax=Mangifera indica TaxID=29780 RepID=UPI001CFA5CB5|nr:5'-adenylylsulfate reductase-like 7 [Mangifera indica]